MNWLWFELRDWHVAWAPNWAHPLREPTSLLVYDLLAIQKFGRCNLQLEPLDSRFHSQRIALRDRHDCSTNTTQWCLDAPLHIFQILVTRNFLNAMANQTWIFIWAGFKYARFHLSKGLIYAFRAGPGLYLIWFRTVRCYSTFIHDVNAQNGTVRKNC